MTTKMALVELSWISGPRKYFFRQFIICSLCQDLILVCYFTGGDRESEQKTTNHRHHSTDRKQATEGQIQQSTVWVETAKQSTCTIEISCCLKAGLMLFLNHWCVFMLDLTVTFEPSIYSLFLPYSIFWETYDACSMFLH